MKTFADAVSKFFDTVLELTGKGLNTANNVDILEALVREGRKIPSFCLSTDQQELYVDYWNAKYVLTVIEDLPLAITGDDAINGTDAYLSYYTKVARNIDSYEQRIRGLRLDAIGDVQEADKIDRIIDMHAERIDELMEELGKSIK